MKSLLKSCNYEGQIAGEPESRMSLVTCQKGSSDISVLSDSADLDSSNYRVNPDGKVDKNKTLVAPDEQAQVMHRIEVSCDIY